MRKRKKNKGEAAKLEMTPMIDVVFQLLIFFIVTLKQEDILSHLDVSRPAPSKETKQEAQPDELLTIMVFSGGYIMNGQRFTIGAIDKKLTKVASFSKDVPVIIKCTPDSPHGRLIALLNVCSKNDLNNLSVFSM